MYLHMIKKLKKTIGKQNLDFMIQKLNANAQPYYTLVDNKGSLLSAPKGYDLNVENFVEFHGRQGNNMASSRIIQRQNE